MKKTKKMKKETRQHLPKGWTPEKVRRVIDYYDHQSEQDSVTEIATADDAEGDQAQLSLDSDVFAYRHPVVVVATGEPYDLGLFPRAAAAVASYSNSAVSINAVARALTGSLHPSGKLPVSIPGASGGTAYPFGTGLRY